MASFYDNTTATSSGGGIRGGGSGPVDIILDEEKEVFAQPNKLLGRVLAFEVYLFVVAIAHPGKSIKVLST